MEFLTIKMVGGLEPWNPKSVGKALGFGDLGKTHIGNLERNLR